MNTKEILQSVIRKMLFIQYKWGGDDPMTGFDCSGGVQEILSSVGLDPNGDQTAAALYEHFIRDEIGYEPDSVNFGDLIFFGRKSISHVAFALNKKEMFEFAGGGSKTNTEDDAAAHNAYGRIRPISSRRDYRSAVRILSLEKRLKGE